MVKIMRQFYEFECQFSRSLNSYFDRKFFNLFFRTVTHMGGATFTISLCLLLILLAPTAVRFTALASVIALSLSHIPVAICKKMYPRRRPYLMLKQMKVTKNPLEDHSFPSGHTTAIFSVLIPFILFRPSLAAILLPIGVVVGLSRIFLGLHYPSDVLAGCFLGTSTGILSFVTLKQLFPYVFI